MSTKKSNSNSEEGKKLKLELQGLIFALVKSHPEYSTQKISQNLPKDVNGKPVFGNHGVQRFLEKLGISTYKKRLAFAKGELPVWQKLTEEKKPKLTPEDRLTAVEAVVKEGKSITSVCRAYKISRPLFYRLLRRYQTAPEDQKLQVLTDKSRAPKRIARKISKDLEAQILELVSEYPELSTLKLAQILWPTVSKKGIHNFFARNNLSIYEQRLAWSQSQKPVLAPTPLPAPAEPELAPSRLRWLISPFTTIPKWIIAHPVSWPAAAPIFLVLFYILEIDKFFRPAMFFPTTALSFGLIFFLYSLKYYFSLVMVLAYPGKRESQDKTETKENRLGRLFRNFFQSSNSQLLAMQQDLDSVKLAKYPFVSVHIPFYNEKRVAERILKACTAFEYPNFEVIIVDDSTDETTQICQKFAREDSRIRLIHREERTGFKGGALREALRICDPKAEYVAVFDADFLPFPDTLEQFVKTFQVLNANQEANEKTPIDANISTNSQNLNSHGDSRIAAVQGYQWHVLNKSENWITRGVRTEYAGSYVVERAGIELYGGLKMIAGSVFCIRADVLRQLEWGTSITEDFELTLKLYQAGYKIAYTPYIQAPSECVSTIRRLVRQRMRWAEGHTYNVRKAWTKLFACKNLTRREKFEFLYLAPYYLQAAFFLIGTMAWFASETIAHAALPFWTASFGWSLVFVNFLSLPLMNLAGLFLEESENRDYLGIASFILLSYILVPFQAYAAVRALFEKEEGPWFRTPKTGLITDVIGKARFYRWFEKLRIFPRPATAEVGSMNYELRIKNGQSWKNSHNTTYDIQNTKLALASSFNPLTGYKIKPRRISLVSRSVLAGLLVIVMFVNYLAFFAQPKPAQAVGTPKIEQQINIMNQSFSNTTGNTFEPTDNSLGLIKWESTKFSDINAVYFEAVMRRNIGGTSVTAALFTEGGTQVTGTGCTVSTTSVALTRVRTTSSLTSASCSGFTSGNNYTARIKGDDASSAGVIQVARLIVLQVGTLNASIINTQTQVEMGHFESITNSSDGDLSNPKFYCYDTTATGTTCSAASPSRWNPGPAIFFEATLKSGDGDVGQNTSIYCVSSTDCKIAYYDKLNNSLQFIQCTAADCTTKSTPQTLDTTAAGGFDNSIYCLSSTDCKIAYRGNGLLKFIQCTAADCTTRSTAQTLDSPFDTGQHASIYCISSTDCKIAYHDATNGRLRFIQCTAADCTTKSTPQTLDTTGDSAGDIAETTAIYCSTSTDCKIAYYHQTNADLKFIQCTNADCTTTSTAQTLDSTGDVGQYNSIDCVSSTDCKISYWDTTNNDLKAIQCTAADCTTRSTAQSIDTTNNVGKYTGIDCVSSTDCKISYYDSTNADLKFIQCTAADCTTRSTAQSIDTTDSVGEFTSIYCSSSTDCKISYYDRSNKDLKFIQCTAADCTTKSTAQTIDKGVANAKASLYTTGGTQVSGSQVTTTSNSYSLLRSGSISLTAGTEYKVRGAVALNTAGNIANAKIILDQAAEGGVSALETVQMYNNLEISTQSSTYSSQNFPNQHDTTNFSGTVTKAFESLIRVDTAKNNATAKARISDALGEVTTTSASNTRVRSASISPATGEKDVQIACTSDGGCSTNGRTAFSEVSWMIIQIQSLPVPEAALIALPGILFLPRIIRWIKNKRKARKKKAAGGKIRH